MDAEDEPRTMIIRWIDGAWTVFDPADGQIAVDERYRTAAIAEAIAHVECGSAWTWVARGSKLIATEGLFGPAKLSKSDQPAG